MPASNFQSFSELQWLPTKLAAFSALSIRHQQLCREPHLVSAVILKALGLCRMKHHHPAHFDVRHLSAQNQDADYFASHGVLSRGPRELEYRNHRLEVRPFGRGWRVFIFTPGSDILFSEVPRSLDATSRDVVIQEAREIVDQYIRKNLQFFETLTLASSDRSSIEA